MSKIEWTEQTWNPVTGCSKVSEGCRHCYAETLSHRFGWTSKPWTSQNAPENVKAHPDRLEKPLRVKRPTMWFVNSMSDLFHDEVSEDFIRSVFAVMGEANQHTFQVLTKRPERMQKILNNMLNEGDFAILTGTTDPPFPWSNVWLGVSVENQKAADERIPLLLQTPATIRFLSCEPLLGPLYLPWLHYGLLDKKYYNVIDWVIVGAESGHGARPMDEEWVRDIKNQCVTAGRKFFYKQNAVNGRKISLPMLDGQTWEQMPVVG